MNAVHSLCTPLARGLFRHKPLDAGHKVPFGTSGTPLIGAPPPTHRPPNERRSPALSKYRLWRPPPLQPARRSPESNREGSTYHLTPITYVLSFYPSSAPPMSQEDASVRPSSRRGHRFIGHSGLDRLHGQWTRINADHVGGNCQGILDSFGRLNRGPTTGFRRREC